MSAISESLIETSHLYIHPKISSRLKTDYPNLLVKPGLIQATGFFPVVARSVRRGRVEPLTFLLLVDFFT